MLRLVFVIFAAFFVQSADAKGSAGQPMRAARMYKTSSSRGFLLGAAGGVVLGTGLYHLYASDYNGRSYSSYYRRKGYYRRGYSDTSAAGDSDVPCTDREVPSEGTTRAWVIGLIAIRNNTKFNTDTVGGLEIDLFRELSWRSQCARPTQVLITLICKENPLTPGVLQDEDYDNLAVCSSMGSESSRSLYGRGRTLLAEQGSIVEFYVGAESNEQAADMQAVVDEMLNDRESDITKAYTAEKTTTPTAVDYGSSGGGGGGSKSQMVGGISVLLVLIVAGLFAFVAYGRWRKLKQKQERNVPPPQQYQQHPVPGYAPPPMHGVAPGQQIMYPPAYQQDSYPAPPAYGHQYPAAAPHGQYHQSTV